MDVSRWPVSNVTLGHFDKRGDVVLLAFCEMPEDTPRVNRYKRDERYPSSEELGWKKLPDPRGPALLMTVFQLWAVYHHEKVAQTSGVLLHGGCSSGGFSRDDLRPLWDLLETNDVVTVRVTAWPRFGNVVKDGEVELFGDDRGHWPGEKVRSARYRLSLNEGGELLIDGVAAPALAGPGPDRRGAGGDRRVGPQNARGARSARARRAGASRAASPGRTRSTTRASSASGASSAKRTARREKRGSASAASTRSAPTARQTPTTPRSRRSGSTTRARSRAAWTSARSSSASCVTAFDRSGSIGPRQPIASSRSWGCEALRSSNRAGRARRRHRRRRRAMGRAALRRASGRATGSADASCRVHRRGAGGHGHAAA